MKLTRELFFPTAVYYMDVPGADALNQFLLTRIYAWRTRDQRGIKRSNALELGAWHSPTTMNALPEFDLFTEQVTRAVRELYKDQLYHSAHDATCHNMWANINPPRTYNRSHTHPGSLWSGVYYVQTPTDCGRLYLTDPRPQAEHAIYKLADDAETGPMHWREVHYQAIAGRLILFPGWLRHEVEPNRSTLNAPYSDRISISFNYG